MKQGIHPEYRPATIVCSCGNEIETRSTQEEIHVEICSVCHPFYTGRQKLVDTAGRVERFKRKYGDTSTRGADEEEEEAEGSPEASADGADEAPEPDEGEPASAADAEAAAGASTPEGGAARPRKMEPERAETGDDAGESEAEPAAGSADE